MNEEFERIFTSTDLPRCLRPCAGAESCSRAPVNTLSVYINVFATALNEKVEAAGKKSAARRLRLRRKLGQGWLDYDPRIDEDPELREMRNIQTAVALTCAGAAEDLPPNEGGSRTRLRRG